MKVMIKRVDNGRLMVPFSDIIPGSRIIKDTCEGSEDWAECVFYYLGNEEVQCKICEWSNSLGLELEIKFEPFNFNVMVGE